MDIPITGLIFHSPNSNLDSEHSHVLYLTSWDGRPLHKHHFSGVTSFNVGHEHRYAGTTKPAPSGVPHTHEYFTVTSFDDGHNMKFEGSQDRQLPCPMEAITINFMA